MPRKAALDDIAKYNQERWDDLAKANIVFSRPALDLDETAARLKLDPHDVMGDANDKSVLCLASGGGQQSVAFGLLGAQVTVFDLSPTQLQRDAEAAAHYGLTIRIEQGDMRDLSRFDDASFDLVWHAHSIKFIPDVRQVFSEVARVLRHRGLYRVDCPNPILGGIDERDWNGECYPLNRSYIDGEQAKPADPRWEVWSQDGARQMVLGPLEFRHTLTTLINGLIENGLRILGLWEEVGTNPQAEPGTWDHFSSIVPPAFTIWCAKYEESPKTAMRLAGT